MSTTRAMKHSRCTDAELRKLCEQVGGVLKKRDGELWLEPIGVQLTYRYYVENGKQRVGDDKKRIEVARKILGDVLEARSEEKTVGQRLSKLLQRVREEHENYQRMTFMHIREPSLDQAVLFAAGGKYTVWLELYDHDRLEVQSTSFLACCDLLGEKEIPKRKEGA